MKRLKVRTTIFKSRLSFRLFIFGCMALVWEPHHPSYSIWIAGKLGFVVCLNKHFSDSGRKNSILAGRKPPGESDLVRGIHLPWLFRAEGRETGGSEILLFREECDVNVHRVFHNLSAHTYWDISICGAPLNRLKHIIMIMLISMGKLHIHSSACIPRGLALLVYSSHYFHFPVASNLILLSSLWPKHFLACLLRALSCVL